MARQGQQPGNPATGSPAAAAAAAAPAAAAAAAPQAGMSQQQAAALLQVAQGIATAITNQNQAMQQLQQVVQGLATQQAQQAQQGQQGQFHLTPLAAIPQGIINYSTKDGKKHHEMATKSLFPTDEKFDVEPSKFNTFMHKLAARATDLGFVNQGRIAHIPMDINQPDQELINIFEDYGTRTLEQIRAKEETYLGQQTRNAQDSKILYDLLMASISTQGHERIAIWKEQYLLNIGGNEYEAGVCLLKVIIREAYLDTNATVSAVRLQLSSLDKYIKENGSDIVAFNAHVRKLVDQLGARGATTQDLLINLFKGYKACKDQLFLSYVTNIEDQHEDGTKSMSATELMNKTSNYYKKRITHNDHPWDSDPIEEKFTALQAKVDKKLKGSKVGFKEGTKSPDGKKGKDGKPAARPDWLTKNIKPSDPRDIKSHNGQVYYWCGTESGGKCGGKWRHHPPHKCKGIGATTTATSGSGNDDRKKKSDGKGKGSSKKQRTKKALRIIAAQEARIKRIEEEDSSSEEEQEETQDAEDEE
jgi:hypothetical protein